MPAVVQRKPGLDPGVDLRQAAATLCTDVANAGRFADVAGSLIRFVPEWGWLRWDGRRWARDNLGVVRKMAQDVHTFVRAEAAAAKNPQIADALWRHAKYTAGSTAISAFLREAEPMLAERAEIFDQLAHRVNCRNCTLAFDQIEGGLPRHYEQCRADYLTRMIPRDWHMGARRVAWENFLADVLPDAEVRAFVQRALGYSLLGHTREQCFFILHGTGCNGKSVFLNTIKAVLGEDYARQADPECFMSGKASTMRNDLARLQGVRFVTSVESGDGQRLDEALIKSITGGDAIQARFLYREYFEFVPQFKLWLATNHPPRIRGTDHAIWRRIMLMPFTVTIPDERRDPALQDTLLREAEGILDWLVEGCVAYCKYGLDPPPPVRAATQAYRDSEDVAGQFLADHAVFDRTGQCAKKAMYAAYLQWCERNGERAMSQRAISKLLQSHGLDEYRGLGGTRYWMGIRLKSE